MYAGMPDIVDLACTNLEESVKFGYPQIISYDTTFEMGDFYVSILAMRNTALVNDPVFPVGFMLHEWKFMQNHEQFLTDILGKLGMDSTKLKKIPFAVNREKGIVAALKKNFTTLSIVFCHNHILRDVEQWDMGGKGMM